MNYFIFTLGCQMNISDSQRIAQKLESIGYKSTPEKKANLVIVNACSVRQTAVDRIWGKIKIWQNEKKKILLTGCVLPLDQKKFITKNIIFFKIKDLPNLKKFLNEHSNVLLINRMSYRDIKTCLNYFKVKPKTAMSVKQQITYIPIMTGCDNFCSYCAVPYTRGREISRPIEDILNDIKNALDNDAKEILLLGQNVNSYGLKSKIQSSNIKQKTNDKFIKLLINVDNLPYNFKFNFLTSNPHDMSDELIDTYAALKKWPRELHLAMQSGDDEILRKMNRRYTANQFLKLVENLKSKIPNLKISTDIIVGFPGETKKQFENTVKLCKKVGFKKAYISQYSQRPGTAAYKLKDNVSKTEKKRRWQILDRLINEK